MMLSTIKIELAGREYPADISYEYLPEVRETPTQPPSPESVVIYSVELMNKVCGAGDWWYDANGVAHTGPAWKSADVLDLLDDHQLAVIKAEVLDVFHATRGIKRAA